MSETTAEQGDLLEAIQTGDPDEMLRALADEFGERVKHRADLVEEAEETQGGETPSYDYQKGRLDSASAAASTLQMAVRSREDHQEMQDEADDREAYYLTTPAGRRAHADPSCVHLQKDTVDRISESERRKNGIIRCTNCGKQAAPLRWE